jgi:hypothetical protein
VWAEFVTDRQQQIEALFNGLIEVLQESLPKSAGKVLFSLDNSLSWMSPLQLPQISAVLSALGRGALRNPVSD